MSSDARMSVKAVQALVERTMRGLGDYAGKLCYVPAQRHLDTPAMRSVGFSHVANAFDVDAEDLPTDVEAALIATVGADVSDAVEIVRTLNESQDAPVIIVAIIVPFFDSESVMTLEDDGYGPYTPNAWLDAGDPKGSVELGRYFDDIRLRLISQGADECLCLFAGEDLWPHRIIEVVRKSEFMAKKMCEIIDTEVNAMENNAARKVQMAYRKFLMILPGRIFENIPHEDKDLPEVLVENTLRRVGPYQLTVRMGTGTFGKVFKAQSQEGDALAIKVIPKANIKNAGMIMALDREVCILLYMPPHPNIVRAVEALHGRQNYYVVMAYAGGTHLQGFTKAMLARIGASVLPDDLITRFSRQQAAALVHLSGCRICHRDVKPCNWIVDDSGQELRLVDFSLAIQVTSTWQPLKTSCGSLPFCAPEVFSVEKTDSPGYNGLQADIWSLAVNYVELISGPYSVEKILGWMPQHPVKDDAIMAGLASLESHWASHEMKTRYPLGTAITEMLVLRPEQRLPMERVAALLGASHGNLCGEAAVDASTQLPGSSSAGLPSSGSGSSSSEVGVIVPQHRLVSALSVKLGGQSGITAAFDQMLDRFLFTPYYSEVFENCSEKLPAIRTFFVSEMVCLFETAAGNRNEEARRSGLRNVLSSIAITHVHFAVLVDQLRESFEFLAVEADAAAQALARFKSFGPDFTEWCGERLAAASARNTGEWRSMIALDARQPALDAFSECLVASIAKSPGLSKTKLVDFSKSDFESYLLQYLGSLPRDGGAEITSDVLPVPREILGKEEHLAAANAAGNALAHSGWSEEVVETLYFTMLQEWLRLHDSLHS